MINGKENGIGKSNSDSDWNSLRSLHTNQEIKKGTIPILSSAMDECTVGAF